MSPLGGRIASLLIGLATAIVIVTASVLPFLSPQWIAFEQGRANATAWTGFTTDDLNAATGAILSDLVFGPPDFDVEVSGAPVLGERERGHMRDVRTVFSGLWLLAAASLVVLGLAAWRRPRIAVWRAVRAGALGLTTAVVGLGIVALVAFDALFELFHQVFFPAGSYTFDPATERLTQFFPFQFWQETAFVVGIVIVAVALVVALLAGRRASQPSRAHTGAELAATPATPATPATR
jgi:integral membrane protein (TIGR01906 family)